MSDCCSNLVRAILCCGLLVPTAAADRRDPDRTPDVGRPASIDANTFVALPLVLEGVERPVVFALRPHAVRDRAHFAVVVAGERGERSIVPPPPTTVRGASIDGSRMRFAGAFVAHGPRPGLTGVVFLPDGERIEVVPDPTAPGGFAAEPVGPPRTLGICGMPDRPKEPSPFLNGDAGGVAGGDVGSPLDELCTAQMACDADFEYFTAWGGIEGAVERIELVTNVMNVQFERDVGIVHALTTVLVRTTAGAPYTSTAHATLLNQFRNEWNANQTAVVRDVAQLFTGKELNGSIIGIAWDFAQICNLSGAYCLSQSDFDGTLASATDLSAHELGHLWNATHCVCVAPPATMNATIVTANTFASSPSPGQIIPFAQSIPCLDCMLVDCNANGIGDATDIAAGTSTDCDGNNIPDECDLANGAPDCNANGLLDACDAIGAPSDDCNGNGIFDACDLAAGTSLDIDLNGVPDECDPDCNANGLPDGADLLNGTSSDCDGDGVPDDCQWADGIGPAQNISNDGAATWNDIGPTMAGAAGIGAGGDGRALVATWIRSLGPWGSDGEVFAARSLDGGRSWSTPAPVVANAATNTGTDLAARTARLGDGRIAVVWASAANLGQPGTTAFREIQIARTDDGGATWSPPAYVHVAALADAAQDAAPDLAGGDGTAIAVWQSRSMPGAGTEGDIAVARSVDNGVTWSTPSLLHATGIGDALEDLEPRIAYGGEGRWLVVWVSRTTLPGGTGDDHDIHATVSTDDGLSWSTVVPINPEALNDGSRADAEPAVEGDGAGGFVVAWVRQGIGGSDGTDYDVWMRRTSNGVEWSDPVNLSGPDTRDQSHVALGVQGATVRIAWRQNGQVGGPFGSDSDVFFRSSDDGGSTWSAIGPVLEDAAEDGTRNDGRPTFGSDGVAMAIALESPVGDPEIAAAEVVYPDCNRNGVADWCDIAGGTAPDRNANGVPDGCEGLRLADLDGDGTVGPGDLAILLGLWGSSGGEADLDGDGTVGAGDLATLLGAWTGP
jgi:hypothetical protein